MTGIPVQLSAALDVLPRWLPTVAVAAGFSLLLIGLFDRLLAGLIGERRTYSRRVGFAAAVSFAASVAGATYVTIVRRDLVLLFALFVFVCGRCVQGAVTARIVQKVLDFVLTDSDGVSDAPLRVRAIDYLASRLRSKAKIVVAVGIIVSYTGLSIAGVFLVGNGNLTEAIRRLWVGIFFVTLAQLSFDARHFAHRVSWTATLGLVVATAGAFLYNPLGTSGVVSALAPYLESPIPEWTRRPLGAVGFLFGVFFWCVFYVRSVR
jgi:hypothetical protein